jgi:hypothetical protein
MTLALVSIFEEGKRLHKIKLPGLPSIFTEPLRNDPDYKVAIFKFDHEQSYLLTDGFFRRYFLCECDRHYILKQTDPNLSYCTVSSTM